MCFWLLLVHIRTYPGECLAHWVFDERKTLFLRGKEVVAPHLEAVQKEATTEKLIGNDKLGENNGKVEELAEDETVEVDVVPEQHHQQQKSHEKNLRRGLLILEILNPWVLFGLIWVVLFQHVVDLLRSHLFWTFKDHNGLTCYGCFMITIGSLVMDVFAEVFHKALPLLVLVFNKSDFKILIKKTSFLSHHSVFLF